MRGGEPSSPPPLIDGRYRVQERIGGGGMAEVFLARDETLDRLVAVKLLRDRFAGDDEFVARFHREARAAAAINHPNVVAIHDRGGAAGTSYIVMEYVPGETLKDRIARGGRLSPAAARDVELALLAALGAAHERHVIHRDVTAQNILLGKDGRVKVADFGIAHVGSSSLTSTGIVMGTSRYLSPEQARGEATDERSDLYAAGVVLFEMLTGRPPFDGDTDLAIALQHANEPAPEPRSLVPDLSPALNAVVVRALRKDAGERFRTAAEFAAALRVAVPDPAAAPEPASPTVVGRPSPSAGPPDALPGGAAGVAAGAAAGAPARWGAVTSAGAAAPATTGATRVAGTDATRVAAPPATAAGVTRVAPGGAAPTTVIEKRRRRGWIWVVLALAIVAATAVAGVFAWQKWSDRPVSVPSVVGADAGKARQALRDAGFKVRSGGGYSDDHAAGTVMSQLPSAGTEADKGAVVALVVSRGPLHLTVANVVGRTGGEAADALRAQTFVPRKRRGPSADVAAGRIFRQRPEAGTSLLRGSPVTYWVSTGPPLARVPDVVGVSQGEATGTLEDAGFDVKAAAAIGLGHTPGDVVRQEPVAGDKVPRGSTVTIWIAIF